MSNEHDLFEDELNRAQNYPERLNHMSQRLESRIKKERRRKGTVYGSFTIMAASLLFIILVNTSTSFVYALSEIPLLSKISQMVLFDESLKSAMENDYIQYVGLKETIDEETLKLPYVIADEKNLVLFFQTDEKNLAPEQMYEIGFNNLRDTDTDTFHGQGFFSFSSMQPDNFSENLGLMQLRVIFSEMELPKNNIVSVTLWKNKNINGEMIRTVGKTFTFPLSLNEFEEPKIYAIDKEIDIVGNKVTFDRMEVYPTGTMLHYRTWKDRQNDLALQFDLMEDGEKTRFSTNFNSTSYEDKYDEHTIRLQDDFFNQPKTRSLLINGYYIIEEDKEFVTLDVEQGLLSRPLENMELIDVDSQEEKTTLVFRSFDSPAEPPIRSFTNGEGIALRILNTQHRISDKQSSFVYEVETKKTSKLIMRVSPTLTSLGDHPIEIPIPIPSR